MGRIYQDEIVGGDGVRRYNIVDSNGNTVQGNVEIRKAYTPQQEGSTFGASDLADIQNQLDTGWIPSTVMLTYASADTNNNTNENVKTYVLNTSVSLLNVIELGWKIKLTNNGSTQKGFVTAISSTTITIFCGADYAIANSSITNVYFSCAKAPLGFSLNPDKWSVILTNSVAQNQASPEKDTVYNLGSLHIDEPIGMWHFCSNFTVYAYRGTAGTCSMFAGLSTSNNSFSNGELKKYAVSGAFSSAGEFAMDMGINCLAHIATAKTRWYIVASTFHTGITNLTLQNGVVSLNVKLTCAYL